MFSVRDRLASLLFLCLTISCSSCEQAAQQAASRELHQQIIFPYQDEHVHGPTIVSLPGGDLLAAWFQGSGERWADDVRIMGARLKKGATAWTSPFLMADVPGFPDINPTLFMDRQDRLWLMWYPVIANQWETSIPMFRISSRYNTEAAPEWDWQDVLFVKPGDETERGIQPGDRFVEAVATQLRDYEVYMTEHLMPQIPADMRATLTKEWAGYKKKIDSLSKGENMIRSGRIRKDGTETPADLGYPLSRRIGWQTKNKAVFVGERMVLPLYSDGLDCTLFALTDDGGKTWSFSNPVLGGAGIQATIALGSEGRLVAYLRDNGPPPKRMQVTTSEDNGVTWSIPKDDILPNPGAGFDMVTLSNGEWLIAFNNQESGRYNLTVAISDDEGQSWKWMKEIENDTRGDKATSSHYPSVIEDKDGMVHLIYSYHRRDTASARTIKYATFHREWIKGE